MVSFFVCLTQIPAMKKLNLPNFVDFVLIITHHIPVSIRQYSNNFGVNSFDLSENQDKTHRVMEYFNKASKIKRTFLNKCFT